MLSHVTSLLVLAGVAVARRNQPFSVTYSTVTGYFLQDLNTTNPSTFYYNETNFGLINQSYPSPGCGGPSSGLTQWQLFDHEVRRLNDNAQAGEEYKLLFIGRHGEGYHNAAQTYYGTPGWNCYWSEVNGNGTSTWEDAHIDDTGVAQAEIAHNFWQYEIDTQKIPTPESYYSSPLSRCLATANITFSGLTGLKRQFLPMVKEYLRESISIHTCDHRSNKSYIHDTYPSYRFEDGFGEFDELWNGVYAETNDAQDVRSKTVLDDIFSSDAATYISITTHSGEAGSILRVLGHQAFGLNTGAIIPVLVKAVTVQAAPTLTTTPAWTVNPHCTSPPLTTDASGNCVCQASAPPVTSTLVNDVYPATTTHYHSM